MTMHRAALGWRGFGLVLLLAAAGLRPLPSAAAEERADIALVLAVDVSNSIDDGRYALQMTGIAKAFEDPQVQESLLAGAHHAAYVGLVEWSNKPIVSIPWTLITSRSDMAAFATEIRTTPRADNQFTCMATALRQIEEKLLPQLPVPADRTIIDVSGDGSENCNPRQPVDAVRDELAAANVTVNGLPILAGDEAATLEAWYREHVIGGPGAFLLPAYGFEDIERAMRQKFVTETSWATLGAGSPRLRRAGG
jgi:hypothetical protein